MLLDQRQRPDLGTAQPGLLLDLLEVRLDGVQHLAELAQHLGGVILPLAI